MRWRKISEMSHFIPQDVPILKIGSLRVEKIEIPGRKMQEYPSGRASQLSFP